MLDDEGDRPLTRNQRRLERVDYKQLHNVCKQQFLQMVRKIRKLWKNGGNPKNKKLRNELRVGTKDMYHIVMGVTMSQMKKLDRFP